MVCLTSNFLKAPTNFTWAILEYLDPYEKIYLLNHVVNSIIVTVVQ